MLQNFEVRGHGLALDKKEATVSLHSKRSRYYMYLFFTLAFFLLQSCGNEKALEEARFQGKKQEKDRITICEIACDEKESECFRGFDPKWGEAALNETHYKDLKILFDEAIDACKIAKKNCDKECLQ